MIYLLDTNTIIYFLNGKFSIRDKIKEAGLNNCAVSEISVAELFYGAEKSNFPDKNKKTINDFIEEITIVPMFDAIQIYGKEKARLSKAGKLISDLDLLIGSTAIANDMIMVTKNTSEFARLEGIKIEDWTKP